MSLLLQPLLRAGARAVNMVVGTDKTWPVSLQRKLSLQQSLKNTLIYMIWPPKTPLTLSPNTLFLLLLSFSHADILVMTYSQPSDFALTVA